MHPWPGPPPPPPPKGTTVGNNKNYNRENLVGPFLVRKTFGSQTSPPNTRFKHSPGPSGTVMGWLTAAWPIGLAIHLIVG